MATAIVPVNHRPPIAGPAAIAEDVAYALRVAGGYRQALAAQGVSLAGQQVLELGPGPSLGPAVCLAAAGAVVTAADLYPAQWNPSYHPAFYESLRAQLAGQWPDADPSVVTRLLDAGGFDASTVRLICAGAEDLDALEDAHFTVVLSNAVLEHVRDVPRGLEQLARVTAPGGLHLHQIDFRDHRNFDRPLEYLTIPSTQFSPIFLHASGECGNRWRHSQFLHAFEQAGFAVSAFNPNVFAPTTYQESVRGRLALEFAALGNDDLRILSGQVVARRLPGPGRVVSENIGPPTPRGTVVPFRVSTSTEPSRIHVSRLSADRPRILVLRSCRMPQFTAAMRWIRRECPDARIVALSHSGFDREMRDAGVDDVIEVSGRRFGVFALGGRGLWRLRRERFDRVVVPQMDQSLARHANLYRVALATGAPSMVVVAPDGPIREMTNRLRWFNAANTSLASIAPRLDAPLMLVLLAVARLARRRPARKLSDGRPLKVLHVISSWGVGGAQAQLAELINRTPAIRYQVQVLVLGKSDGDFSQCRLRRDDIPFRYLDWFPSLSASILEIAALCRRERFDIVHTWLFYANFLGAAGARLAGVPFVVSGVRNLSLWKRAWDTRWWYRLADGLGSRLPDCLTVNARALVPDHAAWALVPERCIDVLPNGLDPEAVRRGADGAREWLRDELGLPPTARLIGTVGRLAPEKDQATFVRLAAQVLATDPQAHAVVVGDGPRRAELERLAAHSGVSARIHFMGTRAESRRVIAGLDVFVLTSLSEGFPNVLLEATILGIPAVSTDVAGAADVLDGQDLFNTGDPAGGARLVTLKLSRRQATQARVAFLRERAETLYSADRMAGRWFELYRRSGATVAHERAHA